MGEAPPTPGEFYEAVRVERPTERQKAIVLMWVTEATTHEIRAAWAQHAYDLTLSPEARTTRLTAENNPSLDAALRALGGRPEHEHPTTE